MGKVVISKFLIVLDTCEECEKAKEVYSEEIVRGEIRLIPLIEGSERYKRILSYGITLFPTLLEMEDDEASKFLKLCELDINSGKKKTCVKIKKD